MEEKPEIKSATAALALPAARRTIELEIVRDKGITLFRFKVDPAITAIYQAQSEEIRNSERWPGLKFYYLSKVVTSTAYKKMLTNYGLFDDYGQAIIINPDSSQPFFNIAWLRTVGGQGEIKIQDQLGIAELSNMVKNASRFIKEQFEQYFQNCQIKGIITMEI